MTAAEAHQSNSAHKELALGLAKELGLPEQEVQSSYAVAFAELSSMARLHEFVPVLALTRVRRLFTARYERGS